MIRRVIALTFIPAILLALVLSVPVSAAEDMKELRPLIKIGEKAVGFTLKDLDGKTHSYKPGDGKPTLLFFFVAACPLCRELTPTMSAVHDKSSAEVRVLGVNLDGNRFKNAVKRFILDNKISFPVALDDMKGDFFVASDPYGVDRTPTAVLVDGKGVVAGVWVADQIRDLVKNADKILSDVKKVAPAKK